MDLGVGVAHKIMQAHAGIYWRLICFFREQYLLIETLSCGSGCICCQRSWR